MIELPAAGALATSAEVIAGFSVNLRYADIPKAVLDKARLHVLDAVGIALAAASLKESRRLERAVRAIGSGAESTAIGYSAPLAAAWAMLLNGMLIHSLEYDDTHTASVIHGSSVVVPAAIASAERERRSGRELLVSIVAGWEMLARLGAAAPGAFQARGFQTTAVCGPFVSAALTARLIGLSIPETVNAIGIAGSQASGVFAFLDNGATVKSLHPGWASHAGYVAAHLASAGMTGPAGIFEARYGFYKVYAGGVGADKRIRDELATLGKKWELTQTSLKLYPCCHYIHSFLECVEILVSEHRVAAADIESMECWVPVEEVPIICDPWERRMSPASGYEAKFSLPYCLAVLLVEGRVDVETFATDHLSSGGLELARRIRYTPIEASGYPVRFPGRVRIRLKSGATFDQAVDDVRGSPIRPASVDAVVAKFLANASRRLSPTAADRIVELVMAVEDLNDLDPLSQVLRSVPGKATEQ